MQRKRNPGHRVHGRLDSGFRRNDEHGFRQNDELAIAAIKNMPAPHAVGQRPQPCT